MSSEDVHFAPGSRFGRYQIVRQIGEGGMGAVYEAVHLDLRKRVAIKTLLPKGASDPVWRARFLREGEAVARLRHPNVVDISDVGVQDDMPYMVMELLEGEDLGALIDRDGALELVRLVDLMLPVFDAVAAAHEEGIVHRDLKPENIFLSRTRHRDVEPKLLDFGISKVHDVHSGHALTATNTAMGTALYMAPEQMLNSRDVDDRCDQYSLGVILYCGSTGIHPYAELSESGTLYELMTAIISGRFEPPRRRRPNLPEGFDRVVVRAMATKRDDRFESVVAVARALLPFASERAQLTWAPRLMHRATTRENSMPAPAPTAAPTVEPDVASAAPPSTATSSELITDASVRRQSTDVLSKPGVLAKPDVTFTDSAATIDLVPLQEETHLALRGPRFIVLGVLMGLTMAAGLVFAIRTGRGSRLHADTAMHASALSLTPQSVTAPPLSVVPTPAVQTVPAVALPSPAVPMMVPADAGFSSPVVATGAAVARPRRNDRRRPRDATQTTAGSTPSDPGPHIYY